MIQLLMIPLGAASGLEIMLTLQIMQITWCFSCHAQVLKAEYKDHITRNSTTGTGGASSDYAQKLS
jgi:hypothetical protein